MNTIRRGSFIALVALLTMLILPVAARAQFSTMDSVADYYLKQRPLIAPLIPPIQPSSLDALEAMILKGDYSFQDSDGWYSGWSDGPYTAEGEIASYDGQTLIVYEDLASAAIMIATADGKTVADFKSEPFPDLGALKGDAYGQALLEELNRRSVALWISFENKPVESASSLANSLSGSGGGGMMMSMGGSNELEVVELAMTNTGMAVTFAWPPSFTNQLDIYSFDGGGFTGLVSWTLADFGYVTTGTNQLRWLDSGQMGRGTPLDVGVRFYAAGKGADVDSDGDGYGDSYELMVLNTATNDPDSDNDGVSDGPFDPDNTNSITAGPDAFPLDSGETIDTDGDGIGNNADTDDDGDGIADANDPDPLLPGIVAPFKVVGVEDTGPTNSADSGVEVFDVSSAGRMLPYASGGDSTNGYGRINGGIYFNHDDTNLYIGIAGYSKQSVGDGDDALLLLMDSKTGGVSSLSAITTGPKALSIADNINFTTNFLVDVGIIVGVRSADGKNIPAQAFGGKEYGQGVYALSGSSASDLSPAFTSTGPSPISQWGDSPYGTNYANAGIEIAIPLADILDAPWTSNSTTFIRVAAIVIGGDVAPNRHLSKECYGESVSGSFGFSATTVTGAKVFLSPNAPPQVETNAIFTDNDVMLQGFQWNVPTNPTLNGIWYDTIRGKADSNELSRFTMAWMPPPSKGNSGAGSVGYDPYDQYDLGTYAEKFTTETRYGSEAELKACMRKLKEKGITPVVDFVLNHMNGGWSNEGGSGRYNYQPGNHETFEKPDPAGNNSNKYFTVNYANFPFQYDWGFGQSLPAWDPSASSADVNELHPYMRMGMKNWCNWTLAKGGYRGCRFDFTQGMQPWFASEVMNYGLMKGRFGVMEYWELDNDASARENQTWLQLTDNRAAVFDMLLRDKLALMCNNNGSFNMELLSKDNVITVAPDRAVTFAESHDTIRPYAEDSKWGITKDKAMAYAFNLISEGMPMVAYNDYFIGPYSDPNPPNDAVDDGWTGTPLTNEINALVSARTKYAGGTTTYLSTANKQDLYIAKRSGTESKPGCILVINDHQTSTLSDSVNTGWASTNLVDALNTNHVVSTDGSGIGSLSAPARSYRVYVRQGDL